MLLPVGVACLCILLSAGLIVSLHYYPQYCWNVHCVAWIVIALALSTKYLRAFAPMLMMWAFWFTLQGEIQNYWRLVDGGQLPPVRFSAQVYTVSVIGMAALGNCVHFQRFRSSAVLILGVVLYGLLLALVPKPRIAKEFLALQQVTAYAALYLAGHILLEVYAQKHAVPNKGLAKLLFSSWVLWLHSPLAILISSTLHLFVTLLVLLSNYDELLQFCALEANTAARQFNIEDPRKRE
jgi:hypothetical protein